jgi:uncharacterized protein (DUF2141 family)
MIGARFYRIIGAVLFVSVYASATASQSAEVPELKIKLSGLRNENGQLLIALYDMPAGFPGDLSKSVAALKVPARSWRDAVVFRNLRPGRYAIIALHDEDGNGQMTKTFFCLPDEGFGVSNNPKLFGPPKFGQAAFDVRGNETLEIAIVYF